MKRATFVLPSNTNTITGNQLGLMNEFAGFLGVNERIKLDEHGKTIGFFYQLKNNLEDL